MDTFARLPSADRQAYFGEAAARMGLPPHVIEKDFWVCWTLKRLFSLECLKENLLFKGGTSLSKAYRLIRRFSEDIEDKSDPDLQSLAFVYPRTGLTLAATAYIAPSVKIEFGARSDHWPAEIKKVQSYMAEAIPDAVQESNVEVKVMDVRRTFWEKATILHQLAHLPADKPFPARYSRHYCDAAEMITLKVGEEAANNEQLLKAVVGHKQTFYRSAWANYSSATRGTLRLLPPKERVGDLSKDLASMREMFFDRPPELKQVLQTLDDWLSTFNRA